MKNWTSVLIAILLTLGCSAQADERFSFSKRELIEGAKNEIKILSNYGQDVFSVTVSNGSISKGVKTSMVIRNGTTVSTQDSVYFWTLCQSSKGVEDLVINSIRGDNLSSEVIHFTVESGPILSVRFFKNTGEKDFFKSTTTEGVTPGNMEGISLTGTSLEFGFSRIIEQFSIEIIKKNKTVEVLKNSGPNITDENRRILESTKGDYIRISQILAHLDCGLKLEIKDPDAIYY